MASHSVNLLVGARSSEHPFEMKSHVLALFTISVLHVWEAESAPVVAKPRQFLPPLPGYIPVYIRPGNTPLEDINLDLAEAFESFALKQGRLSSVRSLSHILAENDVKDENDISSVALDDISLDSPEHDVPKSPKTDVILHQTQHINVQKISKGSRT